MPDLLMERQKFPCFAKKLTFLQLKYEAEAVYAKCWLSWGRIFSSCHFISHLMRISNPFTIYKDSCTIIWRTVIINHWWNTSTMCLTAIVVLTVEELDIKSFLNDITAVGGEGSMILWWQYISLIYKKGWHWGQTWRRLWKIP